MKRFLSLLLAIFVILALTACSNPGASTSPTLTPTATDSAVPETSGVDYSTEIPDVSMEGVSIAPFSNRSLYEDADSIYFLSPWYLDGSGVDHNGLYRFSKADGSATLIAQDVACMAMSGGSVYFASGQMGEYEVVCGSVSQYDTATGVTTLLFTHTQNIYGLVVVDGQIYYTADQTPDVPDALATSLFTCAADGSAETLIADSAYSFCIDGSSFYYMPFGEGEGGPIMKSGLDGSNPAQVVAKASLYHFEISGGTLIYTKKSLTQRDLFSGNETELPDYDDFALLGQFIVLQGEALDARDLTTGSSYRLEDLYTYWMYGWTNLHTGDGNAYLSAETDDGSFELYRIDIANGDAVLTLVGQAQP